ncbi:MAG: hypothetical protein IPJ69_03130 [Deltaproteobacteria bacterium]|nr:MAG: hypothetical protein IPJ69_03130 [Deltaproteobacteria bacterium]
MRNSSNIKIKVTKLPTTTSFLVSILKDSNLLSNSEISFKELTGANEQLLLVYSTCKRIFTHLDSELTIECPHIIVGNNDIYELFISFQECFQKTKVFYEKLIPVKKHTNNFYKRLFYTVDEDVDFKVIYNYFSKDINNLMINAESGFNKVIRVWEPGEYLTLDNFFLKIIEERISTVIVLNDYYSAHILRTENVYLPGLLLNLNIKLINICYDVNNMSVSSRLIKNLFTLDEFKRFCIWPHIEKPWDDLFDLKKITYIASAKEKSVSSFLVKNNSSKDHEIVIISNSRYRNFKNIFKDALIFLEFIPASNQLFEYTLLYHSLIFKIQHSQSDPIHKVKQCASLTAIMHTALSILKYDTIEEISSTEKVYLFGDHDWGQLFPKLYQNKYLSHQDQLKLFSEGNFIYVLLNENFSYLSPNPAFLRALEFKTPFLNFPSLVRLSEWEDLKLVEYENYDVLRDKIKNIKNIFSDPRIRLSFQELGKSLHEQQEYFYQSLLSDENKEKKDSLLNKEKISFENLLSKYLLAQKDKISDCYQTLCTNTKNDFSIKSSRFSQKGFFQQLQ